MIQHIFRRKSKTRAVVSLQFSAPSHIQLFPLFSGLFALKCKTSWQAFISNFGTFYHDIKASQKIKIGRKLKP